MKATEQVKVIRTIHDEIDRRWLTERLTDLKAAYDLPGFENKDGLYRARMIGLLEGRIVEYCHQNALDPRDAADFGRLMGIISWTSPLDG